MGEEDLIPPKLIQTSVGNECDVSVFVRPCFSAHVSDFTARRKQK